METVTVYVTDLSFFGKQDKDNNQLMKSVIDFILFRTNGQLGKRSLIEHWGVLLYASPSLGGDLRSDIDIYIYIVEEGLDVHLVLLRLYYVLPI